MRTPYVGGDGGSAAKAAQLASKNREM